MKRSILFCLLVGSGLELAHSADVSADGLQQNSWGTARVGANNLAVRFETKVKSNTDICRLTKRNAAGEVNSLNILERSRDKAWYRIDLSSFEDCNKACVQNEKCKVNCVGEACSAWVRSSFVDGVKRNETAAKRKETVAKPGENAKTEGDVCIDCAVTTQVRSGGVRTAGQSELSAVDTISEATVAIKESVVEGFSKAKGVASLIFSAMKNRLSRSTGYCYRYVKRALLSAGLVSKYLPGASAKGAGPELVKQGFVNLMKSSVASTIRTPCDAPVGSVLVYDGGLHGHIEIKSESGYVSDYLGANPRTGGCVGAGRGRRLIGVYLKPDAVAYLRSLKLLFTQVYNQLIPLAAAQSSVSGAALSPLDPFFKKAKIEGVLTAQTQDEGYKLLEVAMAKYASHPEKAYAENRKEFQQMVELVILLIEQDPSNYAFELFYPVYKLLKSQTLEVLRQHKLATQILFEQVEKTYLREQREGNG